MTHKLLDSGFGKLLEQIGDHLFIRPAAHAIWLPRLPETVWKNVDAEFKGSLEGGLGKWIFYRSIDNPFEMSLAGVQLECRLNDYGHVGVFFEQKENWLWLKDKAKENKHYLNLFGYTGMSSLLMATSGAKVTHVDASKPVLNWARRNAELSNLPPEAFRFILEDAHTFIRREEKRGNTYDGIVMDPPTFGRGAKGEIWKIEKELISLLQTCRNILSPDANLFLLSAHSHGFSPLVLKNCLVSVFPEWEDGTECGDMVIHQENSSRLLPAGFFARWGSKP